MDLCLDEASVKEAFISQGLLQTLKYVGGSKMLIMWKSISPVVALVIQQVIQQTKPVIHPVIQNALSWSKENDWYSSFNNVHCNKAALRKYIRSVYFKFIHKCIYPK